jgi:Zn-dependent peptidase ImmA (M78 family)
MARSDGFIVAPLSRGDIRERADSVRSTLKITGPRFPIVELYEWVLPEIYGDEFLFEILERREMERRFGIGTHGMTYPDHAHIIIREDIYEQACDNVGIARFSMAHEFGHLVLHGGAGMARRVAVTTPLYCNSEWQADSFAGELLVSRAHVPWDATVDSIARRFKVSHAAARTQWTVFKEEGLI